MNNIREITDESVRQLAQTLKASGLAASETEAVRMAMSMSTTNNKVSQTFEDRREKNIMGLSHLNKGKKEEAPKQEAKEEEPLKVSSDIKVDIPKTAEQIVEEQKLAAENQQSETQQVEEDIDLSNITLEEASSGHLKSENTEEQVQVEQASEPAHETTHIHEETVEVIEEPEEGLSIEFKEDEEFIVQDVVKSPEAPEEQAEEKTPEQEEGQPVQEQAPSKPAPQEGNVPKTPNTPERKPSKDISEMEESKVDLGSVFNFNGK